MQRCLSVSRPLSPAGLPGCSSRPVSSTTTPCNQLCSAARTRASASGDHRHADHSADNGVGGGHRQLGGWGAKACMCRSGPGVPCSQLNVLQATVGREPRAAARCGVPLVTPRPRFALCARLHTAQELPRSKLPRAARCRWPAARTACRTCTARACSAAGSGHSGAVKPWAVGGIASHLKSHLHAHPLMHLRCCAFFSWVQSEAVVWWLAARQWPLPAAAPRVPALSSASLAAVFTLKSFRLAMLLRMVLVTPAPCRMENNVAGKKGVYIRF